MGHTDNLRTYNDGYHVEHHRESRLHWSQLPLSFCSHLEEHGKTDALVFRGVHFFDVGLAPMLGERGLRWLAQRMLCVGERERTVTERVAELRRRLAPVIR